jgi:2-iminobutanoate/2-iminopropanoate deaminase
VIRGENAGAVDLLRRSVVGPSGVVCFKASRPWQNGTKRTQRRNRRFWRRLRIASQGADPHDDQTRHLCRRRAGFGGPPYTPAVRAGGLVFISGQLGLDPNTKQPHGKFEAQVEGAIAGVRALVEAAGGTLENIVKTTVFLADIARFAELNEIYGRHFAGPVRPARSTFQVAALPSGAQVEIEAIAVVPQPSETQQE